MLSQIFESEIADGNITLSVHSALKQESSGKIISIQPSRPGCAQITAFCENGGRIVYLTIGANTPLEVPVEGEGYTKLKGAQELIVLVRAVATGRFEETVWVRGSENVKSVGKLFMDDGPPIKIIEYDLTKTFKFVLSEKKSYKYLLYVS